MYFAFCSRLSAFAGFFFCASISLFMCGFWVFSVLFSELEICVCLRSLPFFDYTLPNKSNDKMGEKCPKMLKKVSTRDVGHFSDISGYFFYIFIEGEGAPEQGP